MSAGPIVEAVAAARRGELIVLPTETVYGIGTSPRVEGATARLFEAKGRDRSLALPVLVGSTEEAERVAVMDGRAKALAEAYWPGPLTIVLRRTAASRPWDLGGDGDTVGLRIPAHPLVRAVLARTGPLATTSANPSGSEPLTTCDALHAAFADLVAIYLCEERPLEGASSTVVDLAHGDARVLREGDITIAMVRGTLPGEEALLDSRPSS